LQARFERTINLYKSVVEGELNGDAMDVGKSLFLHGGAAFRKDVILRGAAVTGTISAIGSTFEGKFNGNRMDVGKSLFLRGGATFKKKVNLLNANIRGSVATKGSTFEGEFNGNAMDVGKSLFLRGGATFKKKVNLLNANIEGSVETRGSTFHGEFVGDSIKVGGYLLLSDGATFKQKVDLLNATIRGNVETDGSTFKGEFNGDSMDVGKSLYLGGGATFNQKVNLLNATVEGNVQTKDSTFEGEFNGDGLVVGGSLFLRGDATFKDRVILIVAQVGSHLQFGQSTFLDQVNMTGARIGDELLISSPAENHGVPSWGPEASLVLRNVETKALQAEMRAWRTVDGGWLPTELKGFAYQRLGGLYADMDGGGVNMAAAPVADLVNWMEQSQPNHDARYTPQPYSQLAEALGRNGSIMKSKKVILERGKHQRRAEDTPMFNKIGLVLVQGLVGFGAYPFRVLYWFAALVIVGVWVASRGTSPELHRFGQWFWYSLENALPLVPLKGTFRDIEHDNGYVDGFFHAQRVLGFILATVLVGALAFLGR
jgi:cytoskeletal protein CcmA (bactofilin family)